MTWSLREALLDLGARPTTSRAASSGPPGEAWLLDAANLGLMSLFGDELRGPARVFLRSDDTLQFHAPDELARLGTFSERDLQFGMSLKEVVADAHEELCERLQEEMREFQRVGVETSLAPPEARARGQVRLDRYTLTLALDDQHHVTVLALGTEPVAPSQGALGAPLAALSADQLRDVLRDWLRRVHADRDVSPENDDLSEPGDDLVFGEEHAPAHSLAGPPEEGSEEALDAIDLSEDSPTLMVRPLASSGPWSSPRVAAAPPAAAPTSLAAGAGHDGENPGMDLADDEVMTAKMNLGQRPGVRLPAASAKDTSARDTSGKASAQPPSVPPASLPAGPTAHGGEDAASELAAVVGEGLASGLTGAIELNADAFAMLAAADVTRAEELEREAQALEARARELRDRAQRLRLRHAVPARRATTTPVRTAPPADADPAGPDATQLVEVRASLLADARPSGSAGRPAEAIASELEPGATGAAGDASFESERSSPWHQPGWPMPRSAAAPPAATSRPLVPRVTAASDLAEPAEAEHVEAEHVEADAGQAALADAERAARAHPGAGVHASIDDDDDAAATRVIASLDDDAATGMTGARPKSAPEVVLVVDDERARVRLGKMLEAHFGRIHEVSHVRDATRLATTQLLDAIVVLRPRADADTIAAFRALGQNLVRPPTLVLSGEPEFAELEGIDLCIDLARRASEVADQVVSGLAQLGVTLREADAPDHPM